MIKASASRLRGNSRWMIHAILGRELGHTALANVSDVIGDRASVFEVEDLLVVATRNEPEGECDHLIPKKIKDFSSLVNDLHRVVDVLPFRFGVSVKSDELVSIVRTNQERYKNLLKLISGYTELNFRWAVPKQSEDTPCNPLSGYQKSENKGFEYLKSKFLRKQSSSRIEQELRAVANEFGDRYSDQQVKWQCGVVEMNVKGSDYRMDCYVIARVELLVRREATLLLLNEGSSLLLRAKKPTVASGPWPPYSFIESGDAESFSYQMQRYANAFPNEAVS